MIPRAEYREQGESGEIVLLGNWTIATIEAAKTSLREHRTALSKSSSRTPVSLNLDALASMDTAGAFAIHAFVSELTELGYGVEIKVSDPARDRLYHRVKSALDQGTEEPSSRSRREPVVTHFGRIIVEAGQGALALLSFFGAICSRIVWVCFHPSKLRGRALVSVIERTGFNALPIVGLLSFLIGVVLAYQGADQLRQFGAEILTVNLLGISILRELGVLLTAIIVAGRSGSAFAAQIGTMQINQEVDAMRTLGLDPMDVLVLPRVIGLSLVMPLLGLYASLMALAGGAMMCRFALDISLDQFVTQLSTAISPTVFWIGIVKAPVFGLMISLVGCYKGLQVRGSAESVGLLTTEAVVVSIFLVIVADAAFSIFYSMIGV